MENDNFFLCSMLLYPLWTYKSLHEKCLICLLVSFRVSKANIIHDIGQILSIKCYKLIEIQSVRHGSFRVTLKVLVWPILEWFILNEIFFFLYEVNGNDLSVCPKKSSYHYKKNLRVLFTEYLQEPHFKSLWVTKLGKFSETEIRQIM